MGSFQGVNANDRKSSEPKLIEFRENLGDIIPPDFFTPDLLGKSRNDFRVGDFGCGKDIGALSPLTDILIMGLMNVNLTMALESRYRAVATVFADDFGKGFS